MGDGIGVSGPVSEEQLVRARNFIFGPRTPLHGFLQRRKRKKKQDVEGGETKVSVGVWLDRLGTNGEEDLGFAAAAASRNGHRGRGGREMFHLGRGADERD